MVVIGLRKRLGRIGKWVHEPKSKNPAGLGASRVLEKSMIYVRS
jgi:hypothetical protein